MKDKSKVWLVSLEASGLEYKMNKKHSNNLLLEYGSNDEFEFPIGYVIQHPQGKGSSYVQYGDFEKQTDLVMRPIVSNIEVSNLEGQLLTIIDASFSDKDQCKAMKDLVRNTLWTWNQRNENKLEQVFLAE